jgi:hypothetical protein
MSTEPINRSTTGAASTIVWAVRAAAVLAVLSILWQGFSASNVIIGGDPALGPHEAGAVVAHVVTGLLAAAVVAHWWVARGAVWPAVTAVVVFAATFVEASLGHKRTLAVHVPLALLIIGGVVAVLGWAFSRPTPRPSAHA